MRITLSITIIIFMVQLLSAQVEDLTFTSDALELEGSLYLPTGDGPFKAAVLVHGSGPIDRYQTIPLNDANSQCLYPELFNQTIQNFKDIALHLQANGVAVLTYDKRTFTHGMELDPVTVSTKDFVTDAQNAVNYLASRSEIDKDEIFLIGHSQGAALIPIVAQNVNVAGLISLAGAFTPPDTLVANQFRNLYLQCLNDTVSGDAIANNFFVEFNKIRNDELADNQQIQVTFPGNPNLIPYGFPIFWRDWFEMVDNVVANYNNSNLPTLLIHGADDWNVPVADAYRFENALSADLTSLSVFEGVNHFLTPITDPKVDENILQTISIWIEEYIVDVEPHYNFNDVTVAYNKGEVLINTTTSLDAAFISTIDGKLLENVSFKNVGLHTFEVPDKHKILLVSLIKDEAIFTKKVLIY